MFAINNWQQSISSLFVISHTIAQVSCLLEKKKNIINLELSKIMDFLKRVKLQLPGCICSVLWKGYCFRMRLQVKELWKAAEYNNPNLL